VNGEAGHPASKPPNRAIHDDVIAETRDHLRHVYWIGGGSGAGKSTVARMLAVEHGFRIYDTDEAMADHAGRMSSASRPLMRQFIAMDMDERWVTSTPDEMLETFPWFRGEGFDLIVDDLLNLPSDPPVIVEGFRILPHRVKSLLDEPSRAVWLLPTPEFRRAAFESRKPAGPPWTFVDKTSDPERALANLLERDRMFTEQLREDARDLGLRVIDIDLGMTADDVAEQVSSALRFSGQTSSAR
jgi:hypothetical protein